MIPRVIWSALISLLTFIIATGFAARMYANGLDSPLLIVAVYLYFGFGGACVAVRGPQSWS